MTISPEQCRMARAGLRLTVRDLAERAGVSASMISRFENDQPVTRADVIRRICTALEARGAAFMDGGSPGVRLKEAGGVEGPERPGETWT